MSDHEAIKDAVATLATSPKVATGVSLTTAGIGFAETLSTVNSVLGTLAILVGILATLLVVRINWVNGKKLQLEYDWLLREQQREAEREHSENN